MRWCHTAGQTRHLLCGGVAKLVGNAHAGSVPKHCDQGSGRGRWWTSCDDDSASPWKPHPCLRQTTGPPGQASVDQNRLWDRFVPRACLPLKQQLLQASLGSAPALPCWGQNEETAPLPCPYVGITKPLLGGGWDFYCDKSLEITYVKPSAWYAHPCRWPLSPTPQPDSGTEATTPCSDSAVKCPTGPYPGEMSSGREVERS